MFDHRVFGHQNSARRLRGRSESMGTRDEIEAVDEAYEKAVANQDVAAIVGLYTQDAFLLPPNSPVAKGADAIGAVLQAYIDAGAQSLELETTALDDQGDLVVEVGRYALGLQPPGVDAITDIGKYLQVFKRQADGSFRIAYDCFNSDEAAS
jgi:ketosteroid isomerase-like protein